MKQYQNEFPNSSSLMNENLSTIDPLFTNNNSISLTAAPSGPEVRAVVVNYISKEQVLQMIWDYTGTSASILRVAFYSVGAGVAARAIK